MDRTGIYGRFNLDGEPIDRSEAAMLGLEPSGPGESGAGQVVDLADPTAVHEDRSHGATTLLLGRIDDAIQVAGRLGMAADTPHATLAREALRRFGRDVRHVLPGEWTLLHREGARVLLAASIAQRDPMLYAHKGTRLALGPDLRQLSRLAWVAGDLDTEGLLFSLGRQKLRAAMDDRTVLADVRRLGAGGFVTFDSTRRDVAPRALPAPAPRWHGNFEDAMAETEALLLRIVRERMWSERIGCLLSGGLDSSTLTSLVARNRQPGQALHCITSAAAAGSGLADETGAASIVADHLGVPMVRVVPRKTAQAYRPDDTLFREWNGPALSPRHYLYRAFADRAEALQLPLLFDGQFGEFTITNPYPLASIGERMREMVRRLRGRRTRFPQMVGGPSHAFLSPGISAALPAPVAAVLAAPTLKLRMPLPSETWGLIPGYDKSFKATASTALGRVRFALPFRDPRLLTFFSGLPARLLQSREHNRAPARHILIGHLPDSIRLRPKGLHFSPDYRQRLVEQAPAARTRIELFRRAGADEWLDLARLDAALADVAGGVTRDPHKMLEVQLTALAAEFIAWWRSVS